MIDEQSFDGAAAVDVRLDPEDAEVFFPNPEEAEPDPAPEGEGDDRAAHEHDAGATQ